MLIITRSESADFTHTLKLEGRLLAPWIAELASACTDRPIAPDRVCLDLCHLTFVDAAGVEFLAGLIRDGAKVIGCSAFVAEMLHLKKR